MEVKIVLEFMSPESVIRELGYDPKKYTIGPDPTAKLDFTVECDEASIDSVKINSISEAKVILESLLDGEDVEVSYQAKADKYDIELDVNPTLWKLPLIIMPLSLWLQEGKKPLLKVAVTSVN